MAPLPDARPDNITELLKRWRAGDTNAETKLFELVHPDLYRLAEYYMRRERPGHTLQPTALLNEAYLKLSRAKHVDWIDRRHFFAFAARSMRRLLIDYARSQNKEVPLPDTLIAQIVPEDRGRLELALSLDKLLTELEKLNPEQCAIVELKFFLGMTDGEAAEALHMPLRTAQRTWLKARTWLFQQLETREWKNQESRTTSAS